MILRDADAPDASVDGIWWPWTENLTTELHDLIAAVTARIGPVSHVSYRWSELSRRQRGIELDDGVQLCTPATNQPQDVMHIFGSSGQLALYVVPIGTAPDDVDRLIREVTG